MIRIEKAEEKIIGTGYKPREIQAYLHRNLKRFSVIVAHRRLGKSVFCVNEVIDRALSNNKKNPIYAYIAPNYSQVERIAWTYFKEFLKDYPGMIVNEAKLRITLPREKDKITIYLLGAEKPESLRGIYLDGCVLDEYSEMSPIIWGQVVRPALTDRLGWCIFISTPRGMNHFHEIYQYAKKNGWLV